MKPTKLVPSSVLASASVVSKHRGGICGLHHVREAISVFLDYSPQWSIERAAAVGLPYLMSRLLNQDTHRTIDRHYLAELGNIGIAAAASTGDVVSLGLFEQLFPGLVITMAASAAVERGQVCVLDWLDARGGLVSWSPTLVYSAVQHGHAASLAWLEARFAIDGHRVLLKMAIYHDHSEIAKLLWEEYKKYASTENLGHIVSSAPLELVVWMLSRAGVSLTICIDGAAARGDIEFLSWAVRHTFSESVAAMNGAAANGHIGVVQWLHKYGAAGCTTDAVDDAATAGHLEVVDWMFCCRTEGCTARAAYGAAVNGHIPVLMYLLRRGVGLPAEALDHVAASGCLAMVRWITYNTLEGATSNAMDWAAQNGHLDVLIWLSRHRAEHCTAGAMDGASSNGHLAVVRWLDRQGARCTTEAMDGAAGGGHLEVVEYLHRARTEGCTSNAMDRAARGGHTSVVMWLHNNRGEGCTHLAMDVAIERGDYELVVWFGSNRTEGFTSAGMDAAAREGHFRVLVYLRDNYAILCTRDAIFFAVGRGHLYIASWVAFHFPGLLDRCDLSVLCLEQWTLAIFRAAFD